MRMERASRRPTVPRWAIVIVVIYLSLVGAQVWLAKATGANLPPMCMFRRVTGYPCPTCGSTRMVLAAAQGRIFEAAAYNPLMLFLAALAAVLLVLRVGFGRRIAWPTSVWGRWSLHAAILVAVLANWAYLLVMS